MTKRHRIAGALAALLGAVAQNGMAQTLPEGPGKRIVETACQGCHENSRIFNAGYNRTDWQNIVHMMINVGAPLANGDVAALTEYLVQNFPEKQKPFAVQVPGPVKVRFTEWQVPTPGSRPHDPFAASDGMIWYTGHTANVLGRLNPQTGVIREYHPDTPNSGPHGLTADEGGNIWYTGNFIGAIGRLHVSTGTFTEYPMPDPRARDPHTLLFDPHGMLWFTVQGGNMVGRLDPKTGEITLLPSPTERSLPYGMVIDSTGAPWYCEFGAPKLARIDPITMQIVEVVLPHADSRPRRIAITPTDDIYYADYARGVLGKYEIKSGRVTEWNSPSGPRSLPYGITYAKGAVWYSEAGTRPNTLVRFDPEKATFQTWSIPSGGGVVRNMMTTETGDLVLAESGVNRVALVEINPRGR